MGYDINDFNDCDCTSGYEEQRKRSKGEIEMSSNNILHIEYWMKGVWTLHIVIAYSYKQMLKMIYLTKIKGDSLNI